MVIIPLSTDAPVYHFPWATIFLIVANWICFVITGTGSIDNLEMWENWALQYGEGLKPHQWLSMNFLHFGFMHIIFNMVFLWCFGLVVEGKLGWWRFLLVYSGIGVVAGFLLQVAMLGYDGLSLGAGGASLCVYGLMAISLVWAPKNEVSCFVFIWVRAFLVDVTIMKMAVFYIGVDFFFGFMSGFEMSSEVLHVTGAVLGFAVGTLFLYQNWVDCENWDLFAVMNGTYGSMDRFQRSHLGNNPANQQKSGLSKKKKRKVKTKKSNVSVRTVKFDDD